jgi:hypothetical protein
MERGSLGDFPLTVFVTFIVKRKNKSLRKGGFRESPLKTFPLIKELKVSEGGQQGGLPLLYFVKK